MIMRRGTGRKRMYFHVAHDRIHYSFANIPSALMRARHDLSISLTVRHPHNDMQRMNSSCKISSIFSTPVWPSYLEKSAAGQTKQRIETYCKAPQSRSPDPHTLRTQRQRSEDVRASSKAAIDMHLYFPLRSSNTPGECIDCCGHAIQLSSSMVAHDDTVTSSFDGFLHVFGAQDTLNEDLHLRSRT